MARPPVLPTPTPSSLHEAALRHLARYAVTEAGLRAVLNRRIDRWCRSVETDDRHALAAQTETLKREAHAVAARLVGMGLIDDAAFAAQRAAGLSRSGRSRRAVSARLTAKGVDAALIESAVPDDPDHELAAALIFARKRRIGPYRRDESPDPTKRMREMATMARAGFAQSITSLALSMDTDRAEERIAAFRR